MSHAPRPTPSRQGFGSLWQGNPQGSDEPDPELVTDFSKRAFPVRRGHPTDEDQLLSQRDIARLLGVTVRAVRNYHHAEPPIPTHREGRAVRYPDVACLQWYIARREQAVAPADAATAEVAQQLEAARAQKMAALAELAEIALARARGELVPIARYTRVVETLATRVRSQLLALPGRYASRTIGLTSLADARRVMDLAMADVLRELDDVPALTEAALISDVTDDVALSIPRNPRSAP